MYYNGNEANTCESCPCRDCAFCNNYCLKIVFAIFAALFLFAIGIIVGALISATVLGAVPAFAVLAAILFVLAAVTGVLILCKGR